MRKTGDIPRGRTRSQNQRFTSFGPGQRSANERKLPEPDENPRRHTVQLVSPGTQRKARPPDGAELMNRSTNQNPSQADSVAIAGSYILRTTNLHPDVPIHSQLLRMWCWNFFFTFTWRNIWTSRPLQFIRCQSPALFVPLLVRK